MYCKPFIITLMTLCLLGGCASFTSQNSVSPMTQQSADAMSDDRLQALLQKASQARSPDREQWQIQAAWELIKRQDYPAANNLIMAVNKTGLMPVYQIQYALVKAALALHAGDAEAVLTWLDDRQIVTADVPPELMTQVSMIKAQAFARLHEYRAVVDEISPTIGQIPEAQCEAVYELLWTALQHLDTPVLDEIDKTAPSPIQGWIALAHIFRDTHDVYLQQASYLQWQQRWPDHAANRYPPVLLQQLTTILSSIPHHIALLLPQTGQLAPAGRVIENGFISAYWNATEQGVPIPDISIYDSASGDIREVAHQAQQSGADMIIGPLDRAKVSIIQDDKTLSVPVLALNYTPKGLHSESLIYQFGLAAEDEAQQIANLAILKQYTKAAVLVPDTSKGVRIAQAFTQAFTQLGGKVTSEQHYAKRRDFKNQIAQLLQFNTYHLAKKPNSLDAYQNPDIDMVFMYASPTDARLFKPILAYYLAGNLPVLAISTLYNAQLSVAQNQDLNGIIFPLTPWAENASPFKRTIEKAWDTGPDASVLYALGADAWMLYPYLKSTLSNKLELYGNTGVLSLDQQRRIHRQLNWFTFKEGQLVPQKKVVQGTDD